MNGSIEIYAENGNVVLEATCCRGHSNTSNEMTTQEATELCEEITAAIRESEEAPVAPSA